MASVLVSWARFATSPANLSTSTFLIFSAMVESCLYSTILPQGRALKERCEPCSLRHHRNHPREYISHQKHHHTHERSQHDAVQEDRSEEHTSELQSLRHLVC